MTESLHELLQKTLGDSYVVERELAAGGMSRVFVATDRVLGRKVVVKVLPPDRAVDISVDRFRREIRVAAQLQHPNIVPLHTAGDASSPLLYYIMPFVEGDSLRARLSSGPRPVPEVIRILRDVASALSHAHERGVVHRDIKPENVLLSGGIAVVTDFGIAKALSDAQTERGSQAPQTTAAGVAIGTLKYMAPEQAAGSPSVDHRADLYALGVMGYELLTGASPFEGRTPQGMLIAHIVEEPRELATLSPEVPPALAELIMRCLSKEPRDRPSSAAEVVAALDAIGTPEAGTFIGRSGAVHRRRWKRWRVLIPAAAIGVAAAVAAGVFGSARRADALLPDRVLVGRFENRTGDASLDALGDVTSDWITRGLTTSTVAEVILAPDTGTTPASRDTRTLARGMGAGTIVTGSYFRQGDSLYLTGTLIDAETGRTRVTVGPIPGTVARPLDAVEQLRQRVAGALALTLGADSSSGFPMASSPPRYDAYREYVLGSQAAERLDYPTALKHHRRAVELDPKFHMAALEVAVAYNNLNDCARTDSVLAALQSVRSEFGAWEANYMDRTAAWCSRDWETIYRTGLRAAELAPKSTVARFMSARSAGFVKRRAQAIKGLKAIDPERSALRGNLMYFDDLSVNLHLVGDYAEQLRQARRARQLYPGRIHVVIYEIDALAGLRRGEELEQALERALSMRPAPGDVQTPPQLMQRSIVELLAHRDSARAMRLNTRLLEWLRAQPRQPGQPIPFDDHLIFALYMAGRYAEARAVADSIPDRAGVQKYRHIFWVGRIAAKTGDSLTARRAMEGLEPAASRPYESGVSFIYRARIAALLGHRDEAVRLLREAVSRAGGPPQFFRIHNEPDFHHIRDYAPFADLMRAQD